MLIPTTVLTQTGASFTGVRAVRTASQSISNNTETSIQFDDADLFDTDGFHDPATNNTRLTIPTGKGGVYLVQGEINYGSSTTGDRVAWIKKNGTDYIGSTIYRAGANFGNAVQVSTIFSLAAGDYVELNAYQVSGGPLAVTPCWFAAALQ